MSDKQPSSQPAARSEKTPSGDAPAPQAQAGDSPAKAAVKGDAAKAAPSEATPNDVSANSAEAPRLVVVPNQKPAGPAKAPGSSAVAPSAQKARSPEAKDALTVPVTPVSPKIRSTELEKWTGHFEQGDFLAMRGDRRRNFIKRLGLFVGLPTLLTALYLFLWATPRYMSEFEITYQTYQNTQTLSSGLVQSILGGGQVGIDPGAILYEYARSATLLHKLDEKLHLREYYSSSKVDYPTRLSATASNEKFLSYYRQHIVNVSEGLGGYLTVDVYAYDPEFVQTLAKATVDACDEMMDQMTARARADEMKFAEDEVSRQEDRVGKAQLALTKFQNEHRDLNPTNSATQFGQIVGSLETQLAQAKTSLASTMSYASANAPQVQNLKNQIAAIEAQLREQRNRLTGGDKTYSQILEEYSRLQLEEQFAQNAYLSAQQGLAVARADAARKQSYLVDFVAPSMPTNPTIWFYVTGLAYVFFGSLSLYAIGSLLGGAFKDQVGL
jgi:capsular polysaccharide transport system permease protein